jgi:hypothetical protein
MILTLLISAINRTRLSLSNARFHVGAICKFSPVYPTINQVMEIIDRSCCIAQSHIIRTWFETIHAPLLRRILGDDLQVEITGSRRHGVDLAYPESDLDFAVISETTADLEVLRQQLIAAHLADRIYQDCQLQVILCRPDDRSGFVHPSS